MTRATTTTLNPDTISAAPGLRVTFREVTQRPDRRPDDRFTSDPGRFHWRFTLTRDGRRFSGYFTGAVGDRKPPTLADLLECLASDATSYLDATSVDDFAEEYGYTEPSHAMRAFRACKRTAEAFERLGLDPYADWSNSA